MEVHVGQRGEIVIPRRIRERYGIRANSTIRLRENAAGIIIQPRTPGEEIEETMRRWEKIATYDTSTWDLSGEPYEDENQ